MPMQCKYFLMQNESQIKTTSRHSKRSPFSLHSLRNVFLNKQSAHILPLFRYYPRQTSSSFSLALFSRLLLTVSLSFCPSLCPSLCLSLSALLALLLVSPPYALSPSNSLPVSFSSSPSLLLSFPAFHSFK